MPNIVWNEYSSGQDVAEALAETVAKHLSAAIAERGAALIALSGGNTPPPFFRALSRRKLAWQHVTVTLVDERFVPPSSERSNARLVTHHLLQNEAARADFIGLYHDLDDVEAAAEKADRSLGALPLPLDVAVLGMGLDGHTASFFPDADKLSALLDTGNSRRVLPVHAPSAREPRMTLSMPLIRDARFLTLHIEGAGKKKVLEEALAEGAEGASPIRTVVDRAATPVHIYWAPAADDASPGVQAAP